MPIEISWTVKNASALHTRMSQAVARSSAPPMQPPWIAQTIGKRASSSALKQSISFLQRLLEAEPLARGARRERQPVAGEDVERHAGGEVLAGRREHHRARRALVAQAAHGVAQRGKERRRHRVHPLGAIELDVGDAAPRARRRRIRGVGHGEGRQAMEQRTIRTRDGLALRAPRLAVRGRQRDRLSSSMAWASTSAAMSTSPRASTRAAGACVGYDQRGHGESAGERGRLAADDDLLLDLAAVDRPRSAPRRPPAPAGPARPQPRRPGGGALRRRRPGGIAAPALAARRRCARPLVARRSTSACRRRSSSLLAALGAAGARTSRSATARCRPASRATRRSSPPIAPTRSSTTGSRRGSRASSSTPARRCSRLAPRWRRADAAALRRRDRLRASGRQRRLRRRRAAAAWSRRAPSRRSSTRSSTSPSSAEVLSVLDGWLDTLDSSAD